MNDKIAKGMINKMVDTKPTYASLKSKEEELLAQLKELREEIAIAENGIVEEKLNTAMGFVSKDEVKKVIDKLEHKKLVQNQNFIKY